VIGNSCSCSITQNRGCCGNLLPNVLHRMSSLKFHVEVYNYDKQDNDDDDRAAGQIAEHNRDGAGHQKNEDRGLAKKRRKAIRGAKRDSLAKLFGP
jgi:hypothetical protein